LDKWRKKGRIRKKESVSSKKRGRSKKCAAITVTDVSEGTATLGEGQVRKRG